MDIAAFDPSLSATGVWIEKQQVSHLITTDKRQSRFERLGHIHQAVVRLLKEARPEVVAVEGYAFGISNSRSITVQAEVGGIIRSVAQVLGCHVIEVPTASWKSKVMGRDMIRAKKGTKVERALYLGFVKQISGRQFNSCDEADAWMIARFVITREAVLT